MRLTVVAAGAALALLAGCTSTQPQSEKQKDPYTEGKADPYDFGGASWPEEKLYEGIPETQRGRHRDSDLTFRGPSDDVDNAVNVAEWVKARRDCVSWCMSQDPQRLDQAIAILDRVVRNVPDATRERFTLGWYLCVRGSHFYDLADQGAVTMQVYQDRGKTDEAKKLEPDVLKLKEYCKRCQRAAIYHLLQYYERVPMQKVPVVGMVWKAYFQLENYREALSWLNVWIDTLPDDEPKKRDCIALREEIRRYLAEFELKGYGKPPSPTATGTTREKLPAAAEAPR